MRKMVQALVRLTGDALPVLLRCASQISEIPSVW